jgi:putative membrane protein
VQIAATIACALVAFAHGYFLVLEMFLWTRPFGRRVFGTSKEEAEQTAVLAKNQGLYNGFLAAGIVWALVTGKSDVLLYFLGCVIVAGIYGAATANRRILFVQALPAAIAAALVFLTSRS